MDSLKSRLHRRLLLGALLVSLVLGVTVHQQVHRQLGEFLDYQLEQVARALIRSDLQGTTGPAWDDDPALHLDVQIWSHEGRLLYRSSELVEFGPGTAPGLSTVRSGPQADAVTLKVFTLSNASRTVQVMHAKTLRDELRWDAVLDVLLPALLVMLAGAILMGLSVKQGLAPLQELDKELSRRDAGSLQPLVLPNAPTELANVAATLNRLLQQLDVSLQAHKRFIADAAHELRTPITALGLEVSNLMAAQDQAQTQQTAQRLSLGVQRAHHLLKQMLTLARLEARSQPRAHGAVDLAALTQASMVGMSALASHRGIEFSLDACATALVQGDGDDTRLLLDNLLGNALKFSPADATVEVTLCADDEAVTLILRDHGPGVPPEWRARIGQPFVRENSAIEGAGLGLSIALEVVQNQGATLAFEDPPDGQGLVVKVTWPVALPGAFTDN